MRLLTESSLGVSALSTEIDRLRGAGHGNPGDTVLPENRELLASLLYRRFMAIGEASDLDQAISLLELDATSEEGPGTSTTLANLIGALYQRYARTGSSSDLDYALLLAGRASRQTDSPVRGQILANYAAILFARYQHYGDLGDLDSSISATLAALQLSTEDDDQSPSLLNNLAQALHARYDQTSDEADLERLIDAAEDALGISTPESRAPALVQLGAALTEEFKLGHEVSSIDRACALLEEAVSSTPAHSPDLPAYLANLASALALRNATRGDSADLVRAIGFYRTAAKLVPDSSPTKAPVLAGLSTALESLYSISGDTASLEEAIEIARRIVPIEPNNFVRQQSLVRLAALLVHKANISSYLTPGGIPDLSESLSILSAVSTDSTTDLHTRILASTTAGQMAVSQGNLRTALDLYRNVVGDISHTSLLSITEEVPPEWSQLTSDAAAAAIAYGWTIEGLKLFDRGRSVHASTLRALHDSLPRLATASPSHAEDVRRALKQLGSAPASQQHRQRSITLERAIQTVRSLPSFENFLATRHGYPGDRIQEGQIVIAVNVTEHRSDAIVCAAGRIDVVPLPNLHTGDVRMRVRRYVRDVLGVDSDGSAREKKRRTESALTETLAWIHTILVAPVSAALESTDEDLKLQHIYWCTSGGLSLLPITGALTYGSLRNRPSVLDGVPSSIVPSLAFVGEDLQESPGTQKGLPTVIAVASDPTSSLTADFRPIRHADELAAVEAKFSGVRSSSGLGIDDFKDALGSADILHFSGHGSWHPSAPEGSSLVLSERETLRVKDLAERWSSGRNPSLVVILSTCSGLGGVDNPDENRSLCTELLATGTKNVVGSILNLQDRHAADFASQFYRNLALSADGQIDNTAVATAVNQATRSMAAKYPETPSAWAAFVHFGG